MSDPFVVIGGDAAGLSGASKCKREDPDREVIVFERGQWVSYAHCGMPYYVKGEVEHLGDLLSLSPEDIEARGIDLRRGQEVLAIDPDRRSVTVERSSDGQRYEQSYGDLLVATGARAIEDPIDGAALDGAFTMHHMDAAAAVRAFLAEPGDVELDPTAREFVDRELVDRYAAMAPPSSAAIVGGGYVGVEMAEAFAAHDLEIHLFQRSDRLLPPFGAAVGERVAETLRENGVELHLETPVAAIRGEDRVEAIETATGERVPIELAVVGVGVAPNAELVEGTDIERGPAGAIRTDEYGRTAVEHVYAAGDCAVDRHAVTGEAAWVPLGLTANRAGRAIGRTVAGDPTPVGPIAGTAVVKAFELECGRTGLVDHEAAQSAGFSPVSETVTARSRSGYYPGAAETTVTLVADRETGRLLGGSIAGTDRAAVRINPVAMACDQGLTVGELERQDFGYAPPFSPVWDPVLVAAKVLGGRLAEH